MDVATLLAARPEAMKLGDVVDGFKVLNSVRLAMQKEVDVVAAVESSFKAHLINNLEKSNEKGVFGLQYKAQHKTKRIPKITGSAESEDYGWPKLYEHIYQTGEFDLLQKRLNDKAVMDRIEAGVAVPGVETMLVSEISITKI